MRAIEPEYITIDEAAIVASLHPQSIRKLLKTGALTPYRPCRGAVRVKLAELRKHVEASSKVVLRKGRGRYQRQPKAS